MARLVIHGARGTLPACTPSCMRHGGHTTCYALETDEGTLIVDAGSGLAELGRRLEQTAMHHAMTILFTHFHMDHLMGLPFFGPLYDERRTIRFARGRENGRSLQAQLEASVGEPFWPISLDRVPAQLTYEDLQPSEQHVIQGVRVSCCPLHHPQPCLAYRLETDQRSFVIATDHEPGMPDIDRALVSFCRGADVLVCDAQYELSEWSKRRGWGHGTWESAARLALDAGVSELLLTHHDPGRMDEQIDAIVARASEVFPATRAAAEGMTLPA